MGVVMRVVAVLFGLLFMVAGALALAASLAWVPETPLTDDGWRCTTDSNNIQQCTPGVNGTNEMVANTMYMQSAQTIGAALFISGAVLNAGVIASSGRRQ